MRPDPGAGVRLAGLLSALSEWAEDLDEAELGRPTPRGSSVAAVVDRLRRRADASGGSPTALQWAEVGAVADAQDLAAALPDHAPPLPRACVAAAVRTTLAVLAERHPGHLVEVRVPPWGAVQIGRPGVGSVHRRGTPPNVVETDADTWLRLATGARSWGDALAGHAVSASGPHAQLGDLLPLT